MWKLLFRKLQREPTQPAVARNPGKLASWIVGWLQRLEARLTLRQRKNLFICYALSFAIGCLLAVTVPFRSADSDASGLSFGHISPVQQVELHSMEEVMADSLTGQFTTAIHLLDSMRSDPHGRIYYDSLNRSRPGFIDSIEMAARFLKSLKK